MNSFMFQQKTNVSLRERVTEDIREAILQGNIKPGEMLKENDISLQMGVSKGPVRDAIRQLEREGLLMTKPYQGIIVSDLNIKEVKEVIIPIRFNLEWFVIKNYI